PEADRALEHYLSAIANAVRAFRQQQHVFVILVATERLDARPARRISEKLSGVPVLTSDDYNMYELVSILRACHMMVSSRYHGILTSMPGLVPSAGITMDERIRNLLNERGHQNLLMNVDDPDLESRVVAALDKLCREREAAPVLQELRDGHKAAVTGSELLDLVNAARGFIRRHELKPGDRCALLAHNSIRWVAMDLAMMAEGLIVVPLYARQSPAELVAMMKDCSPSLLCCSDVTLRDAITQHWPEAPPQFLFDEIFTGARDLALDRLQVAESDPVTIIYTSGTSGEAKGVVLTAGNVGHMLGCTSGRLDLLMEGRRGQDCVFHYLPFC